MSPPELIYIADPMCSWCWGFAPVIDALRSDYAGRLAFSLVMGGLRPGTTEPMNDEMKEFVLHHWEQVHETTGQPFTFDFEVPEEFRYDTEPPCRATVVVRELQPNDVFDFLKRTQAAFYVDNRDVTETTVLADLAEAQGVDRAAFLDRFEAQETKLKTWADFQRARGYGVSGFPSVVLEDARGPVLLTFGYQALEILQPRIDEWLQTAVSAP